MNVPPAEPDEPAPSPAPPSPPAKWLRLLPLLFPLLALLLLWDVLVGGHVLLPAIFLKGMAPWSAAFSEAERQALPDWNILQWDGMAEFYPWRLYAAHCMTSGWIPLWNPHVLCGMPFLANSQSAPLYPLHLLYYLPLGASIAVRMGWLAWVHLSLAALFTYLLAREYGARPGAALIAGTAFELSGFAVAWLELPSFLAVACWIPLVLLCTGRAIRETSWRWTAAAGAATGMMLLAGHLQIAFYGLIAAGCVWVWEAGSGVQAFRRSGVQAFGRSGVPGDLSDPSDRSDPSDATDETGGPDNQTTRPLTIHLAQGAAIVALGLALAAPQMLPSVELSRVSHRAGSPSEAGFVGYVRLALHPADWIYLLAPDYYGLPARGDFWHWTPPYGPPETMEYAGWIGMAALVLALVGLLWGRRIDPRVWLLAALAAIALLLATGSPLARLLYFAVPGFGQTGSPARSLVLFCLSQALLAGLGTEVLLRRVETRWTGILLPLGIGLAIAAAACVGAHLVAQASLPEDVRELGRAGAPKALLRALIYGAGGVGLIAMLAALFRENTPRQREAAVTVTAAFVVAGGLLYLGGPFNVTAPPELVYPETAETQQLRSLDARVATVNLGNDWRIELALKALLPPNSSLAYGWRDAQGYDSLYLGSYRRLLNAVLGRDASPAANANVVFVQNAASPLLRLLGVRYVCSTRPLNSTELTPAPGSSEAMKLYEVARACPEAGTMAAWITGDAQAGLETLRREPTLIGSTALLPPEAPPSTPPRPASAPPEPATRITRAAPTRIRTELPAGHSPLLVLRENGAPGWRATVSTPGTSPTPTRIFPADVSFQAVFAPPGACTVEWRYEPASFRCGLFLALCALAVLGGAAIASVRARPSS